MKRNEKNCKNVKIWAAIALSKPHTAKFTLTLNLSFAIANRIGAPNRTNTSPLQDTHTHIYRHTYALIHALVGIWERASARELRNRVTIRIQHRWYTFSYPKNLGLRIKPFIRVLLLDGLVVKIQSNQTCWQAAGASTENAHTYKHSERGVSDMGAIRPRYHWAH